MSAGLNREFMKNPRTFLQTHLLYLADDVGKVIAPDAGEDEDAGEKKMKMKAKYSAKIYEFDITTHRDGSAYLWMFPERHGLGLTLKGEKMSEAEKKKGVLMEGKYGYVKPITKDTNRIKAHFLPFIPGETTSIQLNANADYFFTVQLSGCQLRFIPAAYSFASTNHPRILHVAGDIADRERENAAKAEHKKLGPAGFADWKLTRGLSMTKLHSKKNPFGYGIADDELVNFAVNKRKELGLNPDASGKEDKKKEVKKKERPDASDFLTRVNVVGQRYAWQWYFYAQMLILDPDCNRAYLYRTWDLPWR